MAAHRYDRQTSHILPPQSIQLRKDEIIGKGGHSEVYGATYTNAMGQQIQVAAKKVPSQSIDDPEIGIMQKTEHKNVIKFYGVWRSNEMEVYIIMEYASKGDLRKFLNGCRENHQRLTKECVWKWIYEAACALHYFASLKLSHRDVKSLNFLIMDDYTLKLGDLGLARPLEKTQQTQMKGTCRWMAPEVTRDMQRSPKSDIFSFGIVMWEMITLGVPFEGYQGDYHIMNAVCDGERPEVPEDCPEVLRFLMTSCWDADRNKRLNTQEVVQFLMPYQSSVSQFVEPDAGGPSTLHAGATSSTDVEMTTVSPSVSPYSSTGEKTLVPSQLQEDNGQKRSHEISEADMATLSSGEVPMDIGELPSGDLQTETTKDPEASTVAHPVSSAATAKLTAGPSLPLYELQHYHMKNKPHGICVIINNIDFSQARKEVDKDFKDRKGSEKDGDELKQLFESLHYTVEEHKDLKRQEMYDLLDKKRQTDHSKYDCFICCILTHGQNGKVHGIDGEFIPIIKLTRLFTADICSTLSGKPKCFIFESCLGEAKQGTTVEHDGPPTKGESIPNEADFVLGYATVPGYLAYRHKKTGSWYIQTLVKTINESGCKHDILELLTIVNKNLSCKEDKSGNKQTASVFNTLRKKMFLHVKDTQASRFETR